MVLVRRVRLLPAPLTVVVADQGQGSSNAGSRLGMEIPDPIRFERVVRR